MWSSFADVFADALELAAAGTLGAVRLVKYQCARQLGRQRRPLGCCRSSRLAGTGRAASSSASMVAMSASIISSSRLSWSALSCSLRRAKRWRRSTASSWFSAG